MSDENRKINFTGFSLAALFIALGFAAAQVLLALKYFETDVLLYENGAQLPGYFYLAAAAVAAVYLVCGIILNKKHSSEIVRKSRLAALSIYLGLICGFVLIAADVMLVLRIIRAEEVILFNSVSDIVTVLFMIASVPAAAYFIVVSFENGAGSTAASILGMFTVAWMALLLLKLYFAMDTALTSPVRILNQIVPMTIMFYLIQEIRYRLGCERPALFRTFSAIAMLIIYMTAALEITAAVMNNGAVTGANLMFKLTEACIGLYITVNTFYLPSSVKFVGKKLADEKNAVRERRRQREENEADEYLNELIEDRETVDYGAVFNTSSYRPERSEEAENQEPAAEYENRSSETDDRMLWQPVDSSFENKAVGDEFMGGFESDEFSDPESEKKIPEIVSRSSYSADIEKTDDPVLPEKLEANETEDDNMFSLLCGGQNPEASGASVKNEKSADKKSVCGDDSDDSFDTVCDMNYEDDIEG